MLVTCSCCSRALSCTWRTRRSSRCARDSRALLQRAPACALTAVCVLQQATATSWTLWVKATDNPGAQYDDKAASPSETVAQFKRRWAAAKRPGLDPSLMSLRLVKRSSGVPSDQEDADALGLPMSLLADPSQTLAEAGVSDGSWLLALCAAPPSRGVRLLSVEALQLARRSVFTVALSRRGAAVGVGVFFKPGGAVTANHIFADTVQVGQLLYGVVHDLSGGQTLLELCITQRDAALDSAFLSCPQYSSFYLRPFSGELSTLQSAGMALCTFKLAVEEELPEFVRSMAVMPAFGVDVGKRRHHLVYTSTTWAGDSGSALLLHDGELVGIHLAVVNSVRESLRLKTDFGERLDDLESSVNDLIRSIAQGCIALLSNTFQ